jgi:hypothetical protein
MRLRRTLPVLCLLIMVRPCSGQTIEARRWSHLPIGSQIVSAGYAQTTGDILFNPVLRIEDAEFELDTIAVKYIRSFGLCGKSARVDLFQAWQSGDWEGLLDGVPASAARDGWADTSVRLAVSLLGAPPLAGKEFAAYRKSVERETIFGVGLDVDMPTGEYMDDKLINLGNNRFTFTPQVGIVHNRGPWSMELTASTSFRTDNDSFFNGRQLEEDPLLFLQAHVVYNIRPGVWLAAGAGYGYGDESTIDGVSANDRKEFVAWGLAFGIPLNRHSSFKFGYIGTRTRADTGSDTDTFTAGVAWMW